MRYRLNSAPYDAGWCHCRTCQLNSGSPAMAFATIAYTDYEVVVGAHAVKRFASSDFGWRIFCGECGTPLAVHVTHQPDTLDFSVATLDEPARIAPGFHIFYASRIPWAEAGDELPRHDRFRP
ncbi:MAG TPA: GFA family protein, partial [Sphingomonas sp.]|nr:GFA family protein [Sphingomonas sp.]